MSTMCSLRLKKSAMEATTEMAARSARVAAPGGAAGSIEDDRDPAEVLLLVLLDHRLPTARPGTPMDVADRSPSRKLAVPWNSMASPRLETTDPPAGSGGPPGPEALHAIEPR